MTELKNEFHAAGKDFCTATRPTNVVTLSDRWRVVACRDGVVVCTGGFDLGPVTVTTSGKEVVLPTKQEVLKVASVSSGSWSKFKGKVNNDAMDLLKGLGCLPTTARDDEEFPRVLKNRGRSFALTKHAVRRWTERAAHRTADLVRSFSRARTVLVEEHTEFLLDEEAMVFYAAANGNIITIWINEYGLGPELDKTITLRQLTAIRATQREYLAAKTVFEQSKIDEWRLEDELKKVRGINEGHNQEMREKARGFRACRHTVFKAHEAILREEEPW